VIRAFNGEDARAELFESARHAADIVHRAHAESDRSCAVARKAHCAWRTAQLEHHDRHAWLPLMALTALILLGLDLRAAYFAAVTLGGAQQVTLLWTALFLVILGLLEGGLAWSVERNKKLFHLIAAGLVVFASLLALLRFAFLAAVGTGLVAAVGGACVFTVCTIMFVAGGFAAIRYAETVTTWQARRHARRVAGTRSDLVRSWAEVAAPAQLAHAGLLLERREVCLADK
jgi:hypothetical protein